MPHMTLFLLQNPLIFSVFWPPCCSLISLYFLSWCYKLLTLYLSRTPAGQLLCLNLDPKIRGALPDAKQADAAAFSLSAAHAGLLGEPENSRRCVADSAAPTTSRMQETLSTHRQIKNFQQKVPCVSRRLLPSRSGGNPAIVAAVADDLVSSHCKLPEMQRLYKIELFDKKQIRL